MGKETSNLQSGSQTVLEEIQSRAVKYEVAISIFKNKVVYINGPFRGGEHDLTMLRKGNLLNLIVDGKLAATDLGYKTGIAAERAKLSLPNAHDSKHLNNFKSQKLGPPTPGDFQWAPKVFQKFFNVLSETFRHGFDKHKFVFEAVAVTVQYQMDNGSPIFSV
jgi:hypothetical protein